MDSTVGHIILHVGKLKAGDYWLLILDINDPTLTVLGMRFKEK